MCGIFGYVGKRSAADVILDGLRRLEYRGYDSAGIAIAADGEVQVRRAEGKLARLADRVRESPLRGRYGVGHTRWATHGRPSEENAHPHRDCSGRIVVVHNGIIENYAELKAELIAAGHTMATQTDTEVVAHLIEAVYDGDLAAALLKVAPRLRGHYAMVLLAADAPDTLVATRRGPNLVIGIGEDEDREVFVSSDMLALLALTRTRLDLEDDEVAILTPAGVRLLAADGTSVERATERVSWDAQRAEKEGHKHFMLKEIYEQPSAIRETLVGRFGLDAGEVFIDEIGLTDDDLRGFERVSLIACGTAYFACMLGRQLIESLARMPADVDLASEFRSRDPLVDGRTLTIAVTQSGETADTLAAMRESRRRGSTVIAVCNVRGSLATREASGTLLTHAGPEIGVASTKGFTAQIAALALIAAKLGRVRGPLAAAPAREFLAALAHVPLLVEQALKQDAAIDQMSRRFLKPSGFLYLGRGMSYPIALEGALKLKEISYIHAEGYAAGEMKHGPIALIDEQLPVVVIAPRDHVREKTLSNIREVKARGGFLVVVGEEGDGPLLEFADAYLPVPAAHPLLTPFVTVVPLQLLAYHIAEKRGCDVDQPRNLAKSVTVE